MIALEFALVLEGSILPEEFLEEMVKEISVGNFRGEAVGLLGVELLMVKEMVIYEIGR